MGKSDTELQKCPYVAKITHESKLSLSLSLSLFIDELAVISNSVSETDYSIFII